MDKPWTSSAMLELEERTVVVAEATELLKKDRTVHSIARRTRGQGELVEQVLSFRCATIPERMREASGHNHLVTDIGFADGAVQPVLEVALRSSALALIETQATK